MNYFTILMVKLSLDVMFKVIGIGASVVVSLICFCAEGPSVDHRVELRIQSFAILLKFFCKLEHHQCSCVQCTA